MPGKMRVRADAGFVQILAVILLMAAALTVGLVGWKITHLHLADDRPARGNILPDVTTNNQPAQPNVSPDAKKDVLPVNSNSVSGQAEQSRSIPDDPYTKLVIGQSATLHAFVIHLDGISNSVADLNITSNNTFERTVGSHQFSQLGPSIYLAVDQIDPSPKPVWATVAVVFSKPSGFEDAGAGDGKSASNVYGSQTFSTAYSASSTSPASSQSSPGDCSDNSQPIFIHDITDVSKINYIAPPPTMGAGPSLKTHAYIGTDHIRVPIYAPADIRLATGSYYENGPYTLVFQVSCQVSIRFNHITEPSAAIKAAFPALPAGPNESRYQDLSAHPSFKAGDLIGYTTGTSESGNWDFGVYNSTVKNKYYNDPTWGDTVVNTTAICPFDYFPANLRAGYVSKFNSTILGDNPPDGESFCK